MTLRDETLLQLSAFLDGELSPSEEEALLHAVALDPELQAALEELAGMHDASARAVRDSLGVDVVAAVMAEVAPDAHPVDDAGIALHVSRVLDGEADGDALSPLLARADVADTVIAFAATNEATRALVQVHEHVAFAAQLDAVPDVVMARAVAFEHAALHAMAGRDGALSSSDERALLAQLHDDDVASLLYDDATWHIGDALRAATTSAAFERCAARAGDAALQAIEAEALQMSRAARTTAATTTSTNHDAPGFWSRLVGWLQPASAAMALTGAAAAIFLLVRAPTGDAQGRPTDGGASTTARSLDGAQALLDALTARVLREDDVKVADAAVDGPSLLADNTADVETLDAASTTMVFTTPESNITVIWVASDDDAGSQGT